MRYHGLFLSITGEKEAFWIIISSTFTISFIYERFAGH